MEEAEEVMLDLLYLHNDTDRIVWTKGPRLPPRCVFLGPPMANLEPEAPVSLWARGFSGGHMWLQDAWDRYLHEEMGAALAFLAPPSMAEKMAAESSDGSASL